MKMNMKKSNKTEWVEKPEAKEYDLEDLLTRRMSLEEFRSLYFCDPVLPTEEEQKEQQELMEARRRYEKDRREHYLRELELRERQRRMMKL